MVFKIYIKIGDKGEIGLFGGCWLFKFYDWIEVYGMVDEFNVFIGLLSDYVELEDLN